MINVNVCKYEDGKRFYISIRTKDSEYTVNGDRIAIYIEKSIPDPLNPENPVSVWQDGE